MTRFVNLSLRSVMARESYPNDINYHITLNTIISVAIKGTTLLCISKKGEIEWKLAAEGVVLLGARALDACEESSNMCLGLS